MLLDGGSYSLTLKKLQEKVSQWFIVVSDLIIYQKSIKIWSLKLSKLQDGCRHFCQIWLYSFAIEIKVAINIIFNNIDLND